MVCLGRLFDWEEALMAVPTAIPDLRDICEDVMSYCVACRYGACLSLIFLLSSTGLYSQSTHPLHSVDQQLDRTWYVPRGETAPKRAHEVQSPTLISPDRLYPNLTSEEEFRPPNSC